MLGPAYPNLSIVCCSWLCFQLWLIVMLMESKWRVMIITEPRQRHQRCSCFLCGRCLNISQVQVKNIFQIRVKMFFLNQVENSNCCFWKQCGGYKERPWPCSAWCSYFIHTPLWPRSLIVPQLKMWFCLTSSILGVMEHAALIRGGGRGHLHFLFAILYKNLMSYNLHMEDYFQTVRASDQASNWTHVVKYF